MDEIDFIGIGAGRSGTTWIVNILSEHPQIFCPSLGKLNYFANTRPNNKSSEYDKRGIKGYLDLFGKCENGKLKGDFSSYYMVNPKVAGIIKKHFPNIKIWACLREPVERAYSDWLAFLNFKIKNNEDFETAFSGEQTGMYPAGDGFRRRGFYYEQLKPYFDLFPKENIKIILHEDLIKNPEKITKEFYEFLGVDSNYIPKNLHEKPAKTTSTRFRVLRKTINFLAEISHYMEDSKLGGFVFYAKRKTNIGGFFNKINDVNVKEFEKPKLDLELKKKLKKTYIEDIEKLEKIIGRNLNDWKH
ncbi:MAG: sulfotransferase [Nanoarchaeota archaeon]